MTNIDEDRELVCRCREGDDHAFAELVRKYQRYLFNIVYRHVGDRSEVEDILQEIFVKTYFSLPRFDNVRPFFPWLYRITINHSYDELRRIRRRRVLRLADLDLRDANSVELLLNKSQKVSPRENGEKLHGLLYRMLNRLPEKQRKIIVLRHLQEVPYPKIAKQLDCTEQAARLKVFRARARLRNLMLKELHQQKATAGTGAWRGDAVKAGVTG